MIQTTRLRQVFSAPETLGPSYIGLRRRQLPRTPVVITLVIFFLTTIWLMLVAIKCQVSGSRKGERQRRGIPYPQVTL